jgi:ribosomal-protein-alanine N-acetyltransferase
MIRHKGTVTIETIRLILRRFTPDDAYDMFTNWASDPEAVKFLPWGPHESIEVTQRRIRNWTDSYKFDNTYIWAICLKRTNHVIGSISAEILNDPGKSCEVGYCLGRQFWRQGIMTEALRAVMHFLFYEIGYERITARHDILNAASGRVMQKVGMHLDKIMYHVSMRRDKTYSDVAIYVKDIEDI